MTPAKPTKRALPSDFPARITRDGRTWVNDGKAAVNAATGEQTFCFATFDRAGKREAGVRWFTAAEIEEAAAGGR